MKFRLGLTGSIGMGKSTTAGMFADLGAVIWDADAAVHRLYSRGGRAVAPLAAIFPAAIVDGEVSRDHLREIIAGDPAALPRIEEIVHPLVQLDRQEFASNNADKIGVFDIPLLFETGGDAEMDATACVTVDAAVQEQRVLDRGTMTREDLARILTRQMPNDEKCARATFVIETDTLEHTAQQVETVWRAIHERLEYA